MKPKNVTYNYKVSSGRMKGQDSWDEWYHSGLKSVAGNYYRFRNTVRNGAWPTSLNILGAAFIGFLWSVSFDFEALLPSTLLWLSRPGGLIIPSCFPRWLRACMISFLYSVLFFLAVMKIRQYLLRMLLSYKGWLYEDMKTQSTKTKIWAGCLKTISGYNPSLYSFQRSLPRLSVPPLSLTLSRLLDSLRPICTQEEWDRLKNESKSFEQGLGQKLQRILVLKSWWSQNYVSDWWEKYVYLMSQSPLPINSNYYGMGHSYWIPSDHQASRAATMTYLMLSFKRLVDREELPPLVLRNLVPLCMAQYKRIFSTTRIPGEQMDELRHYSSSESKHIVVNCRGYYYSMNVFDSANKLLGPSSIESMFEWILNDADERSREETIDEKRQVASLTTLPRDEWAKVRNSMLRVEVNVESLKMLETAICAVVLSAESPSSLSAIGKILMHGDGTSIWFDKSLNILFFKNGQCGINVEHSFADAPVVGHAWEYTMTREILERWYTESGCCMPNPKNRQTSNCSYPKLLEWGIDEEVKKAISIAVIRASKENSDLDLCVVDHDEWGKGLIKKCKISPDAFIQFALQLAYYRETDQFAQTYESSTTRLYLCGRTETVRSCTEELATFIKSINNPDLSTEEKISLLKTAANKHQMLYKQSMNGNGIDRHLFALFVVCKGLGHTSEFLEKIIYRPWTLSTSQQPQQQLQTIELPDTNSLFYDDKVCPGGGFGPASENGYGISYMLPSDHKIFFHISSKKSCLKTDSNRFAKQIFSSLDQISKLFEKVDGSSA